MIRGSILLVGAVIAQEHRPWNRLAEQLGIQAHAPISKSIDAAVAIAQGVITPQAPAADVAPGIAACTSEEVVCSEAMQTQGMNCVLGACVKTPGSVSATVGGTDANGCVLGAGYSWCDAKNKCLRPWEEPCETPEAPASHGPALGGARDANGCVTGGGYSWCESKQKCLRRWEEACEEVEAVPQAPAVGGAKDEHGCVKGGGYNWCASKQKCVRPWEEACEEQAAPIGAAVDEYACVTGGGFQWCQNKQKCLREWEEPCEETATQSPVWREVMDSTLEKLAAEAKSKAEQYEARFNKLQELKVQEKLTGKFEALMGRAHALVGLLRNRPHVAPEQPKIGAYEDHRVPRAGTGNIDAVVDGSTHVI